MKTAAIFSNQFEKNISRVKQRLEGYMAEPENEEKVHDLRTSLRRLEASFRLMPKKARKNNRHQIELYKQFFRANSRVRDYDIIRSRIVARRHGRFLDQVIAEIDKKRKEEMAQALRMVKLVLELPDVSLEEVGGNPQKMNKVASRLVSKIKKRLPQAVSDKDAVEELHELRKDLKKLRYTLEIMPSGRKKQYEKKISKIVGGKKQSATKRLEELQDILGTIHDIDITMNYLSLYGKDVEPVIKEEKTERDEFFNKLEHSVRTRNGARRAS